MSEPGKSTRITEQVGAAVPAGVLEHAGAPGIGWGRIGRGAMAEYNVLLLAVIYFLAVWPFIPELATPWNLSNALSRLLPLFAVAIGQTIVLITAGIDLSVTSIIAMASVVGAWVMNADDGYLAHHPEAVAAGIGAMLLAGSAIGLFNGLAIALLGMPPFIVTLTTMMFVSGWAVWATGSRNIGNLPEAFIDIGFETFAGIPLALWIVAALAVLSHVLLQRTLIGRWLYAVGMSARTSRISGVPVRGTIIFAYVFSGFCAAVAAVLYSARLGCGSPTLGSRILLDVVGAAVIGGTSLFGGKGKILWTLFGVLLFTLIDNTLELLGLEYFTIMMIKGGVILLAAAMDHFRTRALAAG